MRYKRFRLYVWSRTGCFDKFFDTKEQAHNYLKRRQFTNRRAELFSQANLFDYDYKHKVEIFVGWWDEVGKWWTQATKEAHDKHEFGIWFNKFWKGKL